MFSTVIFGIGMYLCMAQNYECSDTNQALWDHIVNNGLSSASCTRNKDSDRFCTQNCVDDTYNASIHVANCDRLTFINLCLWQSHWQCVTTATSLCNHIPDETDHVPACTINNPIAIQQIIISERPGYMSCRQCFESTENNNYDDDSCMNTCMWQFYVLAQLALNCTKFQFLGICHAFMVLRGDQYSRCERVVGGLQPTCKGNTGCTVCIVLAIACACLCGLCAVCMWMKARSPSPPYSLAEKLVEPNVEQLQEVNL